MGVKQVWNAEDAADAIGISYQALCRLIRAGKAQAKKRGPGKTNPWQLHVTEVRRLKELFAPPAPVTCSQATA